MTDAERRIFLMCDYSAAMPVWWESDGAMIYPEELPLTDQTKNALSEWADWFERGENTPWAHQWSSEEERLSFDREGSRLRDLVQGELGDEWVVGYFSELDGERHWPNTQ